MLELLARHWWALALRGVFALLFGLLAFLIPGITLVFLVLLFGAYVLLDGIFRNSIDYPRVPSPGPGTKTCGSLMKFRVLSVPDVSP